MTTDRTESGKLHRGTAFVVLLALWVAPMNAQDTVTFDYEWTAYDRMAGLHATDDSVDLDFTYDGDGLRVQKISPQGTVTYIRDGGGRVLAEYDGAGNLLAEYVYGGDRRIATILPSGQRTYPHTDVVGTALAHTNQDGQLLWRGENLPFGEEIFTAGSGDDWKFGGKELDEDSGLHYFEARHYDAPIGRFPSPDEVRGDPARPESWNRYAYSNNNPLAFVDPDGRQPRATRELLNQPLIEGRIPLLQPPANARTVSAGRAVGIKGLDRLFGRFRLGDNKFSSGVVSLELVIEHAGFVPTNIGLRGTIDGGFKATMKSPLSFDEKSFGFTHGTLVFASGDGPLSPLSINRSLDLDPVDKFPAAVSVSGKLAVANDLRSNVNAFRSFFNSFFGFVNSTYQTVKDRSKAALFEP